MKKLSFLFMVFSLFFTTNMDAQLGKLKNKLKKKASSKTAQSDNAKNANVGNQAPLSEIWKPEVELITDPNKITVEYLKKMENIADWVDSGRLSNDERRHIYNLIKRIGILSKYALGKSSFPAGSQASFLVKDCEVIRYEAINQGKRPSVDGNPYHVLGFKSAYYCPDKVYNTPFHEELRRWFPGVEAIRDYGLKNLGTAFKYIDTNEDKGNIAMCADENGNAVRCSRL